MRRNGIRQKLVLILSFMLYALLLTAQDSLSPGVIHVRKVSLKPQYTVKVSYAYPPRSQKKMSNSKMREGQIVVTDTSGKLIHAKPNYGLGRRDSTFAGPMQWENAFRNSTFRFAQTDSVKSDSAQIAIQVNRFGKIKVAFADPTKNDSSITAFDQMALELILAYTPKEWVPAHILHGHRLRNLDSVVILTIYATDPYMNRFMPIESHTK
jgi:hypothetical protein